MKCLIVSHACVARRYQEKIAILAEDDRLDVTLVVPPYSLEGSRKVHLENDLGDGFRIIKARTLFTDHMFITLYLNMAGILRSEMPDVVYMEEEPCSIVAAQIARARRKMGFKLIFFSWENIAERWYRLPSPRAMVYPRCERLVFSQAHGAVAGGTEAMQALRRRGYRGPIEVIPQFGVDVDVFSKDDSLRLREQLGLEHFVVGYMGRLLPEKGVTILADAVARLTFPFNLLIIGRGPEKKRILRRVDELGMLPKTRFVDAVPHDSVAGYMNCIDVLVLPSVTTRIWKEQFGRILIEAMASEVPVVGSNSGEIPHVIGPAGMVFDEGDPGHLAARISEVFAGDRAKLGKAARRRVQQKYTMRKVAQDLREFIFIIYNSPSKGEHGSPTSAES